MPLPAALVCAVLRLLDDLGVSAAPHPGGTLGAHLQRVQQQLEHWRARPALQLAGLCHAFYGTDGVRHRCAAPRGALPAHGTDRRRGRVRRVPLREL
ncbi:DUF6817 domain-containing protein [Streptomyces sp. NBC_00667]|uniref:DUF6817 domain-containing protein n=1 Tax=unclassified Streptomyces TaxID=2593676 RepID=UPI002E36B52F|nr:hypothetical protein [Streptomyces sp. NBC_00667]